MKGYLLDTNVVSELRKGNRANAGVLKWFEGAGEEELFLSVLVLGEIRCGIERIRRSDLVQARALERWLGGLELRDGERVLSITTAIAERWGRFSAAVSPSVMDGLLAATAFEHELTLVTRNVQDVERTGVTLLNPFQR